METRDPEIEAPPAWLAATLLKLRRSVIGPGAQTAKGAARFVLRLIERDDLPPSSVYQGLGRSCLVTFTNRGRDLSLIFRTDMTASYCVNVGFENGEPRPLGTRDGQGRVSYDYQAVRREIDALFPPGPPPAPICEEVDE